MSDELTLHAPDALRSAIEDWECMTEEERLRWDGARAGSAIRDAILPRLAQHGVVRIRLLDSPQRFEIDALRRMVESIATQIGFLVPQTYANNLIALIEDKGKDYKASSTRGHQTSAGLPFHSDRCDLNVMLYVRGASEGGHVSVVSYEKSARSLERVHASALAMLFEDFPFDLRNERIFPTPEWYLRPILWKHEHGALRGHYIRRFITDARRHPGCPHLRKDQLDALDAFDAVLDDLRPEHTFNPLPGELLIVNNYRVMHARDRYADGGEQGGGRLAIRAWVAPFDSESLPEFLLPLAGALAPGCFRGGVGIGPDYLRMLGQTQSTLH